MTTPITISLPEPLVTMYFNESRKTGKTLDELIVRDLEAYDAYVRGCENRRERGH